MTRFAAGPCAAAAALLLCGCAVGPNFKTPAPPTIKAYAPDQPAATVATPGVAGGAAQTLASGADLPGDWWTLFHSPPLNDLIVQALKANPDLKAAQAALRAAHETTLAQRGAFFPQISGSFSANRTQQSQDLAPTPASKKSRFLMSMIPPQKKDAPLWGASSARESRGKR